MDPLAALLAPLAALLSGIGAAEAPREPPPVESAALPGHIQPLTRATAPRPGLTEFGWVPIVDGFGDLLVNQVRIERSITIRISPRIPRQPDIGDLPEELAPRLVERRMGNCVPIRNIAGVQVGRDNRLLLFLRDQRIVSLGLEKSCRARDFYSGFYVERSSDGQICVERDRLQSRSGANCALTRMRQLVEE
jgi:hypothetical protein